MHLDSCYDRQTLDERIEYDLHTPFDLQLLNAGLHQHSFQTCYDSNSSHIRFTRGSDAQLIGQVHTSIPAWRHALYNDKGCSISVLMPAMYMLARTDLHMQTMGCSLIQAWKLDVHRGAKTLRAVLMLFTLMDATITTEHMTRLWRTYCEHNSIGDDFGDQIRHKWHLLGHGLDVQLYILQSG